MYSNLIEPLLLSLVPASLAQTYGVSYTKYGSPEGDPNCNSALHTSCCFYTYPGYSAAASSNLYDADSGKTRACGTCYYATIARDVNGNDLPSQRTIILMIDNLCPAESAHCAAGPVPGAPNAPCYPCEGGAAECCNDWGMQANIDLCDDSGAAAQLLEPYGIGAGKGWVTVTDCSNWYAQGGQVKYDAGSKKRWVGAMEIDGPVSTADHD